MEPGLWSAGAEPLSGIAAAGALRVPETCAVSHGGAVWEGQERTNPLLSCVCQKLEDMSLGDLRAP